MPVLTDEQIKAIESRFGNPSSDSAPAPAAAPSGGSSVESRMGATGSAGPIVEQKPQTTAADYVNVPWYGDDDSVYSRFKKNAMGDVGDVYKGVVSAVMNPQETYNALKGVGKGAYNTAAEAMGSTLTPEEKETQKYWQAAIQPYKELAEPGGLKRAVAEHPAQLATDLSLPLTGAEGVAARLGMSGTAKALNIASKLNPIAAPFEAAQPVLNAVAGGVGSGASLATGVPKSAVQRAFNAGQEGNLSFLKGMTGIADDAKIWDTADSAFDKLKQAKSDAYVNSTQGMREMTQKLKYDNVNDAFANARQDMTGYGLTKNGPGMQYVNDMQDFIQNKYVNSQHPMAHTPGFFDFMKQDLYNTFGDKAPNPAAQRAFSDIYNSIKGTIQEASPGYADAMMQYQDMNNEVKRLIKQAKMGNANDRQAAVAELLSKRADNRGLIDRLSEVEPELKYLIAGKQLGSLVPQGLASSAMYFKPSAIPLSIPAVYGAGAYATGAGLTAAERGIGPALYEGYDVNKRKGHATGGKVDHASAEKISDQLVAAFARAKKDEELETKVLLNKPDEMIIDALKEAKRAI